MMEEIGTLISEGSNAFLKAEYNILGFFLALFALIVYITVDGIGS
jgi:Na+/H+-translocating membrane pyrophosphatase